MWQNHQVSFYPPKISDLFLDPQNAGHSGNAASLGKAVSFVCGSYIEVSLSIGRDESSIRLARYRTNGCGYLIAAAESLTRKLEGRELKELHGLTDEAIHRSLRSDLEPFPQERSHCAQLVADAVRLALAEHRRLLIEEFRGEEPLICTCFGVTEDALRRVIVKTSAKDADELARHTNAGTGCGSCRMLIEEMIDGLRVPAD